MTTVGECCAECGLPLIRAGFLIMHAYPWGVSYACPAPPDEEIEA